MNKYIVVCFSIHEQDFSTYESFEIENEAYEYMDTKAESMYEDMIKTYSKGDLTISGDTAHLLVNSYHWVWKVFKV